MRTHEDPFVAGLIKILAERDLKPSPVSKAVGLGESFIRDLQDNPLSSPKTINAQKLADYLGLSVSQIIAEGEGRPVEYAPVPVVGQVGAGAEIPLIDAYPKGDGMYHVACPSQLSPQGLVCVEVAGNSMEPAYLSGDILFYRRDALGVPSEAIGRRCVCETEDGFGWVKLLRRRDGQPEGLVDLISFHADSPPMYDQRLKWAAPIAMHLEQAFAKRIDLSNHQRLAEVAKMTVEPDAD